MSALTCITFKFDPVESDNTKLEAVKSEPPLDTIKLPEVTSDGLFLKETGKYNTPINKAAELQAPKDSMW